MNLITQRIRHAIAAKGLDPDDEVAIAEFAQYGSWSKYLPHLKGIVSGEVAPTLDDVPAIAYTLSKFTGQSVTTEEIQKML